MGLAITQVRADYCLARKIKDPNTRTFIQQCINPITGNYRFLVMSGEGSEVYEVKRFDVTPLTLNKSLAIPFDLQKNTNMLINKDNIAGWINKHLNLRMLSEDIGFLSLESDKLNVIMASNSMRFRNAFVISFL